MERVGYVAPQFLEVLDEGDKLSFHFDDRHLFSLFVFFVLACASLFTTFFLEGQGGVSGVRRQLSACVEETWRQELDTFIFKGFFSCANVHFEAKTGEVIGEEVDSSFNVSFGFK